ncbi:PBSX family phage terminase large subunit [Dysgonomonas sp. 520]|uniref:PBSX family phage terminase large subunit n=1 Tax=Dysgonomonas sp. 520 TaxID=2302931 RepID=UPI0013D6C276|nr:terminase large subunit [Dysgonomonas sp. 520]NDW09523.1 terminase [Dysgonomonas sp. 520]
MRLNNEIQLHKPPLFLKNYSSDKRTVVNQGGTSSGKTYTIIDLLFILNMQSPNLVTTVVGQDIPNLKSGAYRDAKSIWSQSSIYRRWYSKPNETERSFTCRNGSVIEFKSFEDEQDARSGKRDYLFINEANGISYDIYWQLAIRTRQRIFIDYNPTSRFWVHDRLLGKDDVELIISDHRHNPYLSEEEHARIENIEDKELFRIYARGLTGKLEELVYQNWELVDAIPEECKGRWIGIDFGFTNDPTSIIDVRLSEGMLFLDEIAYQTGLTNPHIAEILRENGIQSDLNIVADSAEPKSIAELQNRGFRIEGAQKGVDSINIGIDILKRYPLRITRRSKNIRKEILAYKWRKDRDGNILNQPIDSFNHALDAIRYVALNKLGEGKCINKPKVRTTRLK